MPRRYPLSTANAGMTRLRHKGNASPATLYDCLNAYITVSGTIKPRPGTILHTILPSGTKGLVAHGGKLVVFSHIPVTMTDSRYTNVVLRHPLNATTAIKDIHFASPFMGFLYVVASFEDDSQFHFWAEELDDWKADTDYKVGDRVFPTTANGFAYEATRIDAPNPLWAAGVERAVNDVIEPTSANGFKYTVIAVTGANPASGKTEPIWPTKTAATVVEQTFGAGGDSAPVPIPADDGTQPSDASDILDRYDNPAGSFPPALQIK